ncbi:MAG: 2TM domain-containing protein [bacterium]|nr:2TM domain-containing protein [bacterium]
MPYGGSTPYAIVHDHIYSPPPLPSEINPSISPDVEQVVLKALAKNPVERHTTAGEMLSELRQAITPHTAPPPVSPQSTERPSAQPQARPPARPAAPSQAADSASAQDVSPPPIMPRPGSPTPPAPPPVPSMDDLGKQLGEIGERFGERMGQWGERFGQQMGEMGTRLGESVSSTFDGDNRRVAGRQQPRPGAKWVQKGFDGPGFYTVEELNAHERTEEADLSEDERIRRRVLKRIEARREMMGNLTAFAVIIPMLWIIWLFTGGFGSHPWPIWPTLGWGIPTAIAYFNYYNEYGNGRNRREEMIEQEVERERRRLYGDPSSAKAKNDDRSVRLTEDGELTDSFIEEIDAQQKRKNER